MAAAATASSVALLALLASVAHADPQLAAVAAGDDARAAILVGPAGQVYLPDGHGAWTRTHAGGIGNAVTIAVRTSSGVLAGADAAPPYRFDGSAWASVYLAMHAKAVVARGRRPIAAVGRLVFALDGATPQPLPEAPAAVLAIGASSSGVAIATASGVARLAGKAWSRLENAPHVVALASDRWGITADGAADLVSGQAIAWPRGAQVTAFVADGDSLVAASASAGGVDVLTAHAGQLATEAVPITPAGVPIGLAVDHEHRVLIALRDGRVFLRDHGTWTSTVVRDDLPAPRPGPAAAATD